MEQWLFVVVTFMLPNKFDPGHGYETPHKYTVALYEEAAKYEDVYPEEVLAMLIVEHGSAGRWAREDSVGDKGKSLGLYQIGYDEVKEFNEKNGKDYSFTCSRDEEGIPYDSADERDPDDDCVDLFDWRVNTEVAAWLVHRHKRQHARKNYCRDCKGKNNYCRAKTIQNEDGSIRAEYILPTHTWVAHWKCGPKLREFKSGCESRRKWVINHLSTWRQGVLYAAAQWGDDLYARWREAAVEDIAEAQ